MCGKKIRARRKELGLTQAELAGKIGVVPSTVAMYEREEREPKMDMLKRLAEVLECDVNFFFDEKKEKELPGEELLKEYVIYHRDGKTMKVRFNAQQQKLFDSLVEMANAEAKEQ